MSWGRPPNGSTTTQTHTNGLLVKSEAFDNTGVKLTESSYAYDDFDRTLTTTDGRGLVSTVNGYLENGAMISSIDSAGNGTTHTYDVMGRVTMTDAPDSIDQDGNTLTNLTYSAYFLTGQKKAEWGAQTYPKAYEYDEQNRLVTLHTYQIDPNFGTDPALISSDSYSLPSSSAQTKWVYDAQRGFMTRKQYDDGNGTDYTYTPAGRLATRTWARGITTTYSYDKGQLSTVDYSDSTPDLEYSYDSFERITTVTKAGQPHASYTYDATTLQLTTESIYRGTFYVAGMDNGLENLGSATLTRSYDSLLRPTGVALGSQQHQYSYSYDSAGRLATVSTNTLHGSVPQTDTHTYGYLADAPGLLESVTSPSHTVTNVYESNRNVLDTKRNKKSSDGSVISSYDYAVNAIGQRERVNRTGSAFSAPDPTNAQHASVLNWSYDALGQLAKADYSDNTLDQSYAYDQIGNRLSKTQTSDSASYTSNALNQFTSKTANGTTENYTYDADGNLLSDGEQTYTWDGENRLRSSTNRLTSITFHYDYLSRRIAKTTTSIPSDPWIPVLKPYNTVYAYDGWNLILEKKIVDEPYDGIKYTWGIDLSGSLQGAGGVGGLLSVTENNQTYYPTYDGNGNVSEYLDRTSNIVAHYEFDAFGNTIDSKTSGAKANNFAHRFSTKPLDSETGFYYYGYRYYNPVDGTWPSRDPLRENGGINLYGMIENDAINTWDYLGLTSDCCGGKKLKKRHRCCGDIQYRSASKCCCNGELFSSKPQGTGIRKAGVIHTWCSWDGGTGGFWPETNGDPFDDGDFRSPDDVGRNRNPNRGTEIKLSPCKYDLGKFSSCVQNSFSGPPPRYNFFTNNCKHVASSIISNCKQQAKKDCK